MTTEEKFNQAAGTIKKKALKFIACIKGYSHRFHDFHTYYVCRIC